MNTFDFDFAEINKIVNECNTLITRGQMRSGNINGVNLIVYANGDIYRNFRNCGYKLIEKKSNNGDGYNRINCNEKSYRRHRIIGYAFLGLDINDGKKQIDHIDCNRLNNNINNLRVVNNQQNSFNKSKSRGYYWSKACNKYQAYISLNKILIHLGCFDTK